MYGTGETRPGGPFVDPGMLIAYAIGGAPFTPGRAHVRSNRAE